MTINLESMSLKDLKDLGRRVEKAIASFEARKKQQALAEVEATAAKLGFSLAELTGQAKTRKRAPAVPKYANPANKAETWSGRGRKPRWFEAALKSGKSADDMAIR
ncbi:MAG: H-NS histone family protein [Paracoccaceae bacterium]